MLARVTGEKPNELSIVWWPDGVEKTGIDVTAATGLFDEINADREDSTRWRSASAFRS